jgi:hypothetical protein
MLFKILTCCHFDFGVENRWKRELKFAGLAPTSRPERTTQMRSGSGTEDKVEEHSCACSVCRENDSYSASTGLEEWKGKKRKMEKNLNTLA